MTRGDQIIREERAARNYFTMLPNLYDDANLTPHEYRLLGHYARVGDCIEGRRTTARICNMNKKTVTTARNRLADKGWIRVRELDDGRLQITVVDKWLENSTTYRGSKQGGVNQDPPGEIRVRGRGKSGLGGGVNEGYKEEPIKKEPLKKKRARVKKHPFPVQVFRMVTHRHPPTKLHDRIHRVVGDDFWSNLKWGRVVKWWMMSGYNQTNYRGMLDVFANGRSDQGSRQGPLDVMKSYLEKVEGTDGRQD